MNYPPLKQNNPIKSIAVLNKSLRYLIKGSARLFIFYRKPSNIVFVRKYQFSYTWKMYGSNITLAAIYQMLAFERDINNNR